MDNSIIYQQEINNDGAHINLFLNPAIGAWCAYGKSAYGLRLFHKSNGYLNMRGYSPEMQQPCTISGIDAIPSLLQSAKLVLSQSKDEIQLEMLDKVDNDSYAKWVEKLKSNTTIDDEIVVKTQVSQFVPKGRFIKDNMSSFSRNVKRMGDAFLAAGAMVVFSPLFLFSYLAIKLEDGGPAIFKQERIGRFGRPFNIYKFRSMKMDAEKNGPQLSHSGGDNDRRLTKIGKFIRAHHLDELPQLYNVFVGDMAFIGPRPERKFFIDQIMEHDPRYAYLYQIRPGVTSYATLYNGYTDTMEKMLRRLEYDLYYLGHRSWIFDFKVLFNTFCSIVFGKKF